MNDANEQWVVLELGLKEHLSEVVNVPTMASVVGITPDEEMLERAGQVFTMAPSEDDEASVTLADDGRTR